MFVNIRSYNIPSANYRLHNDNMISGPKYCMDTTYIGKCTSWVSVRRQCDFRLQYSTGCLFHGQQFESQQELRTENGILTWQVTSRSGPTQI